MYVVAKCRVCKKFKILNVGMKTIGEVIAWAQQREFGECIFGGWHVELGSLSDYMTIETEYIDTLEEVKTMLEKSLEKAQKKYLFGN